MRQWNVKRKIWDTMFPQTVTSNILRRDNGGVLEDYLHQYDKHVASPLRHLNHTRSYGTYRHLEAHIHDKVLCDGFPLLLTVHTNVECEPTLDFNNSGPKPIISGSGDRIPGGQKPGTTMFMVYGEKLDSWILLSSDIYSDVTKVVLPVEREYAYEILYNGQYVIDVPGFDHNIDKITINYGQTIFRFGIDYDYVPSVKGGIRFLNGISFMEGEIIFFKITSYITTAKRGTLKYDLETKEYKVTVEKDTDELDVPVAAIGAQSYEINYGQTILRNNLDYTLSDDEKVIKFKFPLTAGEVIVWKVTEFIESNGSIVPNNFGATGNYRYALKVLHEEYEADRDHTTVIPVPNYNKRRDELTVIRDNHMLVYDVDYDIDVMGAVVLLTTELNKGDHLYFTILQGAMMDVPNFNVIDATGTSGQHIHLDITYDQLCDHYCLLVKLKYDLETAPTAKCIDGPAEPIADCFGSPVRGGYVAGSYIWLVYNEAMHTWFSLSHSQIDITKRYPTYIEHKGESNFIGGAPLTAWDGSTYIPEVAIEHNLGITPTMIHVRPIEPPNVDPATGNYTVIGDIWMHADEKFIYVGNSGNATSKFEWIASTQCGVADLETYLNDQINAVKARIGNVVTKLFVYEHQPAAPLAPGTELTITVPDYVFGLDKLLVNYGQTVLREELDYNTCNEGIRFHAGFDLAIGDIIQFTIIKQEPLDTNRAPQYYTESQ